MIRSYSMIESSSSYITELSSIARSSSSLNLFREPPAKLFLVGVGESISSFSSFSCSLAEEDLRFCGVAAGVLVESDALAVEKLILYYCSRIVISFETWNSARIMIQGLHPSWSLPTCCEWSGWRYYPAQLERLRYQPKLHFNTKLWWDLLITFLKASQQSRVMYLRELHLRWCYLGVLSRTWGHARWYSWYPS